MTKLPLYHQITKDGRGGIPGWWFGAPVVAFAYEFLTPRFIPEVVSLPLGLPENMAPFMRWFVGLLLGVTLLSAWRIVQWARSRKLGGRA
jgi:hypothetical protein